MQLEYIIIILLGFLFFTLSSGDKSGDQNKFDKFVSEITGYNINTSISFNGFRIHHWMILSIFLIFSNNLITKSFCIGGIIQAFTTYNDCFKIVFDH